MEQLIEITITTRKLSDQQLTKHKIKIPPEAISFYNRYPLHDIYTIVLGQEFQKNILSTLDENEKVESVIATIEEIRRLESLLY